LYGSDRSDGRTTVSTQRITGERQTVASVQAEFRRMSALSTLISHAIAERVGIHSTDMECLDVLLMSGPATAGQLAERTGLTTGAVTRLVDRLASRGLVRRREDPADRRRVIVEPVLEFVRHFLAGANAVALQQLQALRESGGTVRDSAETPDR